ncbi:MAG: DNA methyltransferase, partial [Deltaproteobacteria bacterium]|nr:DNA methyltransferase [Deltaproteobacteria bacterium]
MLKSYIKKISDVTSLGDAREESYYSSLEGFIKDFTASSGKKNIEITTLPKKTEAGNPDFRVWDGKQHIVGYIEAKKPTETNLDNIEESEQLKRYLHTFPNLILTNFLEFRLYQHGELAGSVQVARPAVLHKLKTAPPVEKEAEFFELLEHFFSFSTPKLYYANTLAIEL